MTCRYPGCDVDEADEDIVCAAHRNQLDDARARTRQQQREEARERAAATKRNDQDSEYSMSDLRNTSDAPVPYNDRHVALFLVAADGAVSWAYTAKERRDAVRDAAAGKGTLYAAWGGRNRTDLFIVDDLDAAGEALRIAHFAEADGA